VTVAEVAASIGTGLAKAALGGKIGTASRLVDTSFRIERTRAGHHHGQGAEGWR
jgi:threonyl-tRNA synthetase